MALLLSRNVIISSHLSSEEIRRKISENVEPYKFRLFSPLSWGIQYPILFEGQVADDSFKIKRINYRSVSYPVINGRIREGNVEIKMRVSYFGFVTLIILFVPTGAIAVLSALDAIMRRHFSGGLLYFGFFILGYLLFKMSFDRECRIAESWLKELLSK